MHRGHRQVQVLVQFHIDHQPGLVQAQIVQARGHVFAHLGACAIAPHDPLGVQTLGCVVGQVSHDDVDTRRCDLQVCDFVLQAHLNAGVCRQSIAQDALDIGLVKQIIIGPAVHARCRGGLALEQQLPLWVDVLHAL